ncbi:uncharacterized protein LOC135717568 [Ochlerotatus camptorhynchus]|uniref:uncharacterized protein LOC135717568 n=1 Tax=Ochlerotatus camptorhynchus TaxID=644619 RepID=UPI0031D29A4E
MPFAVVETLNARGCKELSVVPDQWLRKSKSGHILFWPNANSVAEQNKLIRDEKSCPKKSWLKFGCTVRRNPISSFTEGKRLMEELSGESSSDVSQLIQRKRKHQIRETDIFQKMFVLENQPVSLATQATTPPTPVIIKVRESVRNEILPQATTPTPPPPPPPPPAAFETISEENVETIQYVTTAASPPPPTASITEDNIQTVQYVTYETVQTPDALTEPDKPTQKCLSEIVELLHQINNRLDRLEKRTADITTQHEFILDAIRKFSTRVTNIEDPPLFCFDPIEQEQELADLEAKLADNDFKSKMVKWLRLNVSGDCADNRMLGVLDMLFSKQFQTKCTWTGASRKGPKIAIMPNRNILQLFQQIGTDEAEVVTHQKLASFFMRKLKNSLKRLIATGMRRGTRHVRRRKQQREIDEQEVEFESDAGSIFIPSIVLNGQDDERSHSHIRNTSNSHIRSESDSDVDSSDA